MAVIRDWTFDLMPGDIVEAISDYAGYFTVGKHYEVEKVVDHGYTRAWIYVKECDGGFQSSWDGSHFKLVKAQATSGGSHSHSLGLHAGAVSTTDPYLGKAAALNEVPETEEERKNRIWRALQGAAKQ